MRTASTLRRHLACTRVSWGVGRMSASQVLSACCAYQALISSASGRRPSRSSSVRHQSLKGCRGEVHKGQVGPGS